MAEQSWANDFTFLNEGALRETVSEVLWHFLVSDFVLGSHKPLQSLCSSAGPCPHTQLWWLEFSKGIKRKETKTSWETFKQIIYKALCLSWQFLGPKELVRLDYIFWHLTCLPFLPAPPLFPHSGHHLMPASPKWTWIGWSGRVLSQMDLWGLSFLIYKKDLVIFLPPMCPQAQWTVNSNEITDSPDENGWVSSYCTATSTDSKI